MKPFNDLNAAVVGSGFIGAVHIDSIRRLGVNIAGIVGSSADRAKSKAREFGVRHTYASYDEMLADASVDVVHITSPNDEHPAQAEAALKAGKHVICEKPLALTSTETDRLRTVAGDSGLVAAVGRAQSRRRSARSRRYRLALVRSRNLRDGTAHRRGPGRIAHLCARKETAAGARRDLHQWRLGHDHRCDDNI